MNTDLQEILWFQRKLLNENLSKLSKLNLLYDVRLNKKLL